MSQNPWAGVDWPKRVIGLGGLIAILGLSLAIGGANLFIFVFGVVLLVVGFLWKITRAVEQQKR